MERRQARPTPGDRLEPPPTEGEARVRRAAHLARIQLGPEEVARLAPQFSRILEAFGALEALELAPATDPAESAEPRPPLRPDEPRRSAGDATVESERLLDLAPERLEDFFGVPKTVDRES